MLSFFEILIVPVCLFLFVEGTEKTSVEWLCDYAKNKRSYLTEFGEGYCFFEIPKDKVVKNSYFIWNEITKGKWSLDSGGDTALCYLLYRNRGLHLDPPRQTPDVGFQTFQKLIEKRTSSAYRFPLYCASRKDDTGKIVADCPVEPPSDETYGFLLEYEPKAANKWNYIPKPISTLYTGDVVNSTGVICQISPWPTTTAYTIWAPTPSDGCVSTHEADQLILQMILICVFLALEHQK